MDYRHRHFYSKIYYNPQAIYIFYFKGKGMNKIDSVEFY
jgi:hypothetical protein